MKCTVEADLLHCMELHLEAVCSEMQVQMQVYVVKCTSESKMQCVELHLEAVCSEMQMH